MLGGRGIAVALVVLLTARIGWALLAPSRPVSDFLQYDNIAMQIATEGRYDGSAVRIDHWFLAAYHDGPTAYRMPGYPLALALGYRLFGANAWWGYVLNCLLAAGALIALWSLLRRVCPPSIAMAALLFVALYPDLVYTTSLHGTDLAGTSAVVMSAGLLAAGARRDRAAWILLASGVLLGFAIHCRPYFYLLVPVWFAVAFAAGRSLGFGAKCRRGAQLALGVALTVVPWAVRNHVVMGHAIWTYTSGWQYALVYNYLEGEQERTGPSACLPLGDDKSEVCHALYGTDEVEMAATARRLAIEWIRSHPAEFARRGVRSLQRTFVDAGEPINWVGLEPIGADSAREDRIGGAVRWPALRAAQLAYGFLIGATLVAFWLTRRHGLASSGPVGESLLVSGMAGSVIGAVAIAVFLFGGTSRYNLPIVPLLAVSVAARLVRPILSPAGSFVRPSQ
jgi:hypothetical protein